MPDRSIADRLIRPVLLSLGWREWPLLVTYGVLLDAEEASGVDMLGSAAGIVDPTGKAFQSLLWASLRRAGCEWTREQVGRLLTLRNLAGVRLALVRAFAASMPPLEGSAGGRPSIPKPALTWVEAWASAREMGLSDAEWLDMTPLQLHELRKCYVRRLQREELMFSRLTAHIVNYSMRGSRKWIPDDHFMLHPFERPEAGPLTGEEIQAKVAAFKLSN